MRDNVKYGDQMCHCSVSFSWCTRENISFPYNIMPTFESNGYLLSLFHFYSRASTIHEFKKMVKSEKCYKMVNRKWSMSVTSSMSLVSGILSLELWSPNFRNFGHRRNFGHQRPFFYFLRWLSIYQFSFFL